MAPKRRGSIFGAPVATRKRSERRPAPQPSPSSNSSSSSSTPSAIPGPSSPQVDLLAGKVITMGRKVNFGFFEDEGFSIGKQIKDMGWEKVCSLDVPTYPALVKDFYLNLSRGDGGLISFVRGTRIHLTFEILGRLLDIPVARPTANAYSDREAALSRMLGRDVEFEEVRANQLPLELRLLHNICSKILFTKTTHFEYISERDIIVMDAIVIGQPINLPCMMIWYMAEAGSKKRSTLPYGMILTLAFQDQGVAISDNEPKKNLRHTDYYSLATVHRMRFIKKNGNWERKGHLDERATDVGAIAPETSVRHILPGPSSPAPLAAPASATSSFVQVSADFSDIQMEQLKSLFANHKEEIKTKLDNRLLSIRELVYSLDDRVSKIESSFGSSSEVFKTDLMHIFKKIKDIGGDSDTYSVAAALIDSRLNDFIKIQSEGMRKILEQLKRLLRF